MRKEASVKKLASIIGMRKRAAGGSYLKNFYLPGAQNSEPVTAKNPDYINMLKDKNKELSAAEARQAFWKDLAGSPVGRFATTLGTPAVAGVKALRRVVTPSKRNTTSLDLTRGLIQPINYGIPAGLAAQAMRGDASANQKILQGMRNWENQQIRAQRNKYK